MRKNIVLSQHISDTLAAHARATGVSQSCLIEHALTHLFETGDLVIKLKLGQPAQTAASKAPESETQKGPIDMSAEELALFGPQDR